MFAIIILLVGIFASKRVASGEPVIRRLTITVDTNGYARIFGVPLQNKHLRNGTFCALGKTGLKAEVQLPNRIPTPGSWSNLLETLQAISSANLLPTNSSRTVYEFSYE